MNNCKKIVQLLGIFNAEYFTSLSCSQFFVFSIILLKFIEPRIKRFASFRIVEFFDIFLNINAIVGTISMVCFYDLFGWGSLNLFILTFGRKFSLRNNFLFHFLVFQVFFSIWWKNKSFLNLTRKSPYIFFSPSYRAPTVRHPFGLSWHSNIERLIRKLRVSNVSWHNEYLISERIHVTYKHVIDPRRNSFRR